MTSDAAELHLWCNPPMLSTLKELFGALQPQPAVASAHSVEHTLQLATAVMLIEVMRADPDIGRPQNWR